MLMFDESDLGFSSSLYIKQKITHFPLAPFFFLSLRVKNTNKKKRDGERKREKKTEKNMTICVYHRVRIYIYIHIFIFTNTYIRNAVFFLYYYIYFLVFDLTIFFIIVFKPISNKYTCSVLM